ncbi:MAG: cation:dicarboxylate symporter family transporter, partial [Myxococcota bacterium]
MRSHVWMAAGLLAGLLLGLVAAALAADDHPALRDALARVRPLGTLFLNLLQMVVIPLVVTALFSGIAKLGELRAMGRLVWRTLAFFVGTTVVAILIGLAVAVTLLP